MSVLTRINTRLEQFNAENGPKDKQELWMAVGGLAMLVGSLAFLYQATHVAVKEFLFAREAVRVSLREACDQVKSCQKAELRMVYLREQKLWQKQLAVAGKNVVAEDVGLALSSIVEKEVRSPVYRWALSDARPINVKEM